VPKNQTSLPFEILQKARVIALSQAGDNLPVDLLAHLRDARQFLLRRAVVPVPEDLIRPLKRALPVKQGKIEEVPVREFGDVLKICLPVPLQVLIPFYQLEGTMDPIIAWPVIRPGLVPLRRHTGAVIRGIVRSR